MHTDATRRVAMRLDGRAARTRGKTEKTEGEMAGNICSRNTRARARARSPRFGSFDVSGLSKRGYAAARKLLLTDRSRVSSEYRTLSGYRYSRLLRMKRRFCVNQFSISAKLNDYSIDINNFG